MGVQTKLPKGACRKFSFGLMCFKIIVFARNPRLGKIKTRLAKSIGNKNALKVYLHLLEHTAHVVGELKCVKHIYYDSFIEKDDIFNEKDFS